MLIPWRTSQDFLLIIWLIDWSIDPTHWLNTLIDVEGATCRPQGDEPGDGGPIPVLSPLFQNAHSNTNRTEIKGESYSTIYSVYFQKTL